MSSTLLKAQELFGVSNSNYAGQMGLTMNPASVVGAPFNWELQCFSLDANTVNNYLYLKQGSGIIRKSFSGANTSDATADRFTSPNKWSFGSTFFKAPAFVFSDKKFGLAFSTSLRAGYSAIDVPWHLAKFGKEGFDYDPLQGYFFEGGSMKVGMISWQEIAFTAGVLAVDDGTNYLSFGLTGKNNRGFESAFGNLDAITYNSSADSLLIIQNVNMNYGHSLPENDEYKLSSILDKRGKGWGINAGLQYIRNRNASYYRPCASNTDKPYDFKLGFSVIDLGYLTFNREARTYKFENLSTDWFYIDTAKFIDVTQIDSLISAQLTGKPTSTRDSRKFKIATPTAVSMQLDCALDNHFFVNLTIIQRIVLSKIALRRMNQIAITPRYERKRFEAAFPISFYEQFKPRIGIGIRYGILTIGSDMLSPLFGITDSYGADFYMGVSIKSKAKCGGESGRRKRHSIEKCKVPNH
ncbi:MAG: DUF5723 family protein [Bacteroidota bacterium]